MEDWCETCWLRNQRFCNAEAYTVTQDSDGHRIVVDCESYKHYFVEVDDPRKIIDSTPVEIRRIT